MEQMEALKYNFFFFGGFDNVTVVHIGKWSIDFARICFYMLLSFSSC